MTMVELKTSIVEDLNHMNAEMLESVSHYVKRLRRHSRLAAHKVHAYETVQTEARSIHNPKDDGITPRVLRFKRGNPWMVSDEAVDRMREEYLQEKYR